MIAIHTIYRHDFIYNFKVVHHYDIPFVSQSHCYIISNLNCKDIFEKYFRQMSNFERFCKIVVILFLVLMPLVGALFLTKIGLGSPSG